MAHGFSNRVWVATSTTGTGDVSIGAAKPAHCTPEQAGTPDGAERTWLLEEGNDFEIYRGAYDDINKTVERGTVILSLIAGVAGTARMNLAGTATLRIVSAAEDLLSALETGAAGRNILAASDTNAALAALGSDLPWYARGIGEIVYVDTSIAGVAIPPQSHPDLVFVQLTAGLTGAGQYNEGKLISESVSGAFPLTVATAVVNVAGSPIYGKTINLLNTEYRFLRPSAESGVLESDAIQRIAGYVKKVNNVTPLWTAGSTSADVLDGPFTHTDNGSATWRPQAESNATGRGIGFDSALVTRTSLENRPKNLRVQTYMRVK